MAEARDTIAALSTAAGVAGVAVIRVSGPRAADVAHRIVGGCPAPRSAVFRAFREFISGDVIDRGLVLWFPSPSSFTGEDVLELHGHGGRAVVSGLLAEVCRVPGVRPAVAGEFTRRAFENGKLDLAQVEGLADLLVAETRAQARQALAQLDGRLAGALETIRDRIVHALALTEAVIDFPDEDDVSADVLPIAQGEARAARSALERLLLDAARGERIRDGVVVAIGGAPNAGKSSLLNALARRDVAIVSDQAGTTRDVLEVDLDLDGVAVRLIDTAGLRESSDGVEREGIRRARERLARADLVIWLEDSQDPVPPPADLGRGTVWRIGNKIDLGPAPHGLMHAMSLRTGEGVEAFLEHLVGFARENTGGEPAAAVRERHVTVLRDAMSSLDRALVVADWTAAPEFAAEELRAAVTSLGHATGRVGVEAVLDVVFSSFCIGK